MNIFLLNGPCTKRFARTGRWQASPRGSSLWYPIWLGYATGVLERDGHHAVLVDAPALDLTVKDVIGKVKTFSPDLCIIDTSTASITYDMQTAEQIKKALPITKICLVGPHASACTEEVLQNPYIDFAFRGEYDYTVRDLAKALADKKDFDPSSVLGMSYRNGGRIVSNPVRPLIDNLDEIPFASDVFLRHLNINRYSLDFTLHPYISIMTSRGCPSKCTFCLWPQTLARGKYRLRSLDNVFAELDQLINQAPKIREIFFDDDTFTVKEDRIREFCERYSKGRYPFLFSVNSKPNFTREPLIRRLKEVGLRCFVAGFESGNQEILDRVKKGVRLDEALEFAQICKRVGIQLHGDFVIGLPGETLQTIDATVQFAKKLNLSTFQISIAMPLPGTEFYNWLKEKGYLTKTDYREWISENGMQQCVIEYPELSGNAIVKAVNKAIRRYYFSGSFWWTMAKQILRNPSELKRYLLGAKRFVSFVFKN